MKTWQDQKIGTRLGVVFGAILLCVIAVGGFGLNWLGRMNSNMSAIDAEALQHGRVDAPDD